jgi:phenylpropionate dioxygenase-like ring-hydroxylating dioxygenase large terminal subunit
MAVPVEHRHWHPVALAAGVGAAPLAVQLLDQPLVLWRDAAGAVQAWADRCPHRGARLSLGCVRGGQLECPYHGWRFAGSGQVVVVPALPDFTPPATHHATVFDCTERYGLVWVRLAAEGEALPPVFAAEDQPRLRKLNCGPYDVASSAPRIVENFLDMAHMNTGWVTAPTPPCRPTRCRPRPPASWPPNAWPGSPRAACMPRPAPWSSTPTR